VSVTAELWTCDECGVTEHLAAARADTPLAEQRRLVQAGHAQRHAAERRRGKPIAAALADAIEALASVRVRLVVAPGDLDRVRSLIVRRGVSIEVFADGAVAAGHGYVMTPRRGVRELPPSTPGDGGNGPVT
jgi:hypothetical protein